MNRPIVITTGAINLIECEFQECKAGGVSIDTLKSTEQVSWTGCVFKNCSSSTEEGGALYIETASESSILTITESTFSHCATSAIGGSGGAIRLEDIGDDVVLEVANTLFENNNATVDGGAISLGNPLPGAVDVGVNFTLRVIGDGANPTQSPPYDDSAHFVGNIAESGNGAAIDIGQTDAGLIVVVQGSLGSPITIKGNDAALVGGGISVAGSMGTADLRFANVDLGSSGQGNVAGGGGGALHIGTLGNGSTIRIGEREDATSGPVSVDGNSSNMFDGGGVWFENLGDDATVRLRDLTATNNSAAGNGGAIAFQTAGARLNLNATNVTLQFNQCDLDGGGLSMAGIGEDATILLDSVQASSNDCMRTGGGISFQTAGARLNLNAIDVILQLNHCEFDGGGLSMADIGDDATILLNNVQASQNDCTQTGGGVSLKIIGNTPTINISDSDLTDNMAGGGGGMWLDADGTDGSIVVTNSVFSDNSFQSEGGGLAIDGFADAVVDIEITANLNLWEGTGLGQGGGVWVQGGPSTININDSVLTNNSAGDGGGFWSTLEPTTIANMNATTITGNIAALTGGGMSIGGGQLQVISNSNCSSNTATIGRGGGIFTKERFPPRFRGAGQATGIIIDACEIESNTSEDHGAGLHIDSPLVLVRDTLIRNNNTTADESVGAGLYNASGKTRLRACEVSGNEADPDSPDNPDEIDGIFVVGGAVEIRGTALCDTHAPTLSTNAPYPLSLPALVDFGLNDLDSGSCVRADVVLYDGTQSIADYVSSIGDFDQLVIELPPGTYTETSTIDVVDRNIAIVGLASNGSSQGVTISGGSDGAVVAVQQAADVWLECLTITDGKSDQGAGHFGGVFVSGSSAGLHIENCNISNNNSSGLVVMGGGTMDVVDCQIHGNTASNNPNFIEAGEGTGGGIRFLGGDINIFDTSVYENQADDKGGGINIAGLSGVVADADLQAVLVDTNTSGTSGGGMAVSDDSLVTLASSPATNSPCVLSNNNASQNGGNIYIVDESTVEMDLGTIEGGHSGLHGGGVYLDVVVVNQLPEFDP